MGLWGAVGSRRGPWGSELSGTAGVALQQAHNGRVTLGTSDEFLQRELPCGGTRLSLAPTTPSFLHTQDHHILQTSTPQDEPPAAVGAP